MAAVQNGEEDSRGDLDGDGRIGSAHTLFTAPTPPEAGLEKYDPSVGVMLAINRYGAGVPMYRTAKWQGYFGVPLPQSTQWEQIERAARSAEAVYQELIEVAAQARLLYHDDTTMQVQSLREQILRESGEKDRTGVFTTSLICQGQEHQVALFFTGAIMSLIHTCALEGCNPFDYLMALQKDPAQVIKHPSAWLPWNYPRAPT